MADAHSARPFRAQAWARDAAVQGDFPRQSRVWPAVIRVPGWGGILCHPQARSRGEAGPANCASWLALWGHGLVEFCSGPRRALTVLPGAVPRGLRSGTPLSIPANGIYSPQTTPETQTDSLSEPRGRISASPRSQTLLIGSLSVKPAARAPSTSLVHLRSGFAKRLVSGVSICFRKIIR